MKKSLFRAIAKESQEIPVPEEGKLTDPQDKPEETNPDNIENLDLPEEKVEEPTPEEEDRPVDEPASEEEVTDEPQAQEPAPEETSETEEVTDAVQDTEEENQTQEEEKTNKEMGDNAKASAEIGRMVITLEAFEQQIADGDMDEQSRAMMDTTIATIQSDIGVTDEPVPATESISNWSVQTSASIERLKTDLYRGLRVCNEGIWNKVKAALGNTEAKVQEYKKQLTAVEAIVRANPAFSKQINLGVFPYLNAVCGESNNVLVTPVHALGGACVALAQFIAGFHSGKISQHDGWEESLGYFEPTVTHGILQMDVAMGTGPQAVVASFNKVDYGTDKAHCAYAQQILPRKSLSTAIVELDQKTMLEGISAAKEALDGAIDALIYVEKVEKDFNSKTHSDSDYAVARSNASIAAFGVTCVSQLFPRTLSAVASILAIAKG